ncbi:MAG TPA: DNA polymerase III subunit delta [Dehalococcoidia bacterium]|nr:DNA polymerase III subunit delta [Dehalococcoidia bacterium]
MLYVLYGAEPVGRTEALDAIKAKLDTDGALATNITRLDAAKTTAQEVIAACDTLPFLGEHRLVILEGLPSQAVSRGKRPSEDEEEDEDATPAPTLERWEPLVAHISEMPPSTTLVVLDGGDRVTAANAMVKKLKPLGEVMAFQAPQEKFVADWLSKYVKAHGFKIDAAALRLLAELIGPNTVMLVSELEKLAAYTDGAPICADDVRELVSRAKEQKGYYLADAVANGEARKAVRLLQELIDDGAVLQVVVSTIAGRYRRIAVAKEMMEGRAGAAQIASRIGITEGAAHYLMESASRLSWPAIRAAYARVIECELDQKRWNFDDRAAVELMVLELAARPPRAA